MTNATPARHEKGTPIGGRFTNSLHLEDDAVTVADPIDELPEPQRPYAALGFSVDDSIRLHMIGVDAETAERFAAFQVTDPDELIALHQAGMSPQMIEKYQRAGVSDTAESLRLKEAGVSAAHVDELRKMGVTDFETAMEGRNHLSAAELSVIRRYARDKETAFALIDAGWRADTVSAATRSGLDAERLAAIAQAFRSAASNTHRWDLLDNPRQTVARIEKLAAKIEDQDEAGTWAMTNMPVAECVDVASKGLREHSYRRFKDVGVASIADMQTLRTAGVGADQYENMKGIGFGSVGEITEAARSGFNSNYAHDMAASGIGREDAQRLLPAARERPWVYNYFRSSDRPIAVEDAVRWAEMELSPAAVGQLVSFGVRPTDVDRFAPKMEYSIRVRDGFNPYAD